MPNPSVLITIETSCDATSQSCGLEIVDALERADLQLTPEQVGSSEEAWFEFEGRESFVRNWWAIPAEMREDGRLIAEFFVGPHWRRKSSVANQGFVKHVGRDVRGESIAGYLWFQSQWNKRASFDSLFDAWSRALNADIGMFHVFTDHERQKPQSRAERSFSLGNLGSAMQPGLPNLAWGLCLGPKRQADVDIDAIRAAGFRVSESDGLVSIRVTENPADVVDNFAHFSERRRVLKDLFRPDYFWVDRQQDGRVTGAPGPDAAP